MEESKDSVAINNSEVKNKVIRLFTYLEKALSLDTTIVRDFRSEVVASSWWLANLPLNVDSLTVKQFEYAGNMEDALNNGIILKVQKKDIESAPKLPKRLIEWVEDVNPLEKPVAKEKIDREVNFSDSSKRVSAFSDFKKNYEQGQVVPELLDSWIVTSVNKLPEIIEKKYESELFSDHPELQELLDGYIKNDWTPWSLKVNDIYKANVLYDQLYALRLVLKNEGDSYELLLGHGILTWNNKSVGPIYAPMFLTPLVLDFDASKRTIEISTDALFKSFVEISSLSEMSNPAEMELITWCDKVNADPFDFWHYESLKTQTQFLINTLSAESVDNFQENIVSSPLITDTPSIWNAPVIFTRKRNNDLWSKYSGLIRRDLEQNSNIETTDFIADLVGAYEAKSKSGEGESNKHADSSSISEGELFFPLPWNDEQKRIAERLDANYGVVVKGPPGTGKSHTIANLISRFLAQGKTVLVTSQTSKALQVLRDKLPENIRSLAVSQLHQTAKKDGVLQQSISEISSNLGERHTKFSEQKEKAVRDEVNKIREEKSLLANRIREYILTDSSTKLVIDGEDVKPIDAAKLIKNNEDNESLAWFTDSVDYLTELNFSEEDIDLLFQLTKELDKDDRKLDEYEFPDISKIPESEMVFGAFESVKELEQKAKPTVEIFADNKNLFAKDELNLVTEKISIAKKVLASIIQEYQLHIFRNCLSSSTEKEKWSTILKYINEKIEVINKLNNSLLGHEVSGDVGDINKLSDGIVLLKNKLSEGVKIGTFTRLLLPADAKNILETCLVDGRVPDNSERVTLLENVVLIRKLKKEIATIIKQSAIDLSGFFDFENTETQTLQLESFLSSVTNLVTYSEDFHPIKLFADKLNSISFFSKEIDHATLENLNELEKVISSFFANYQLQELKKMIAGWCDFIKMSVDQGESHPSLQKLLSSLKNCDEDSFKEVLIEIKILIDKKHKSIQLRSVSNKIRLHAPNLYHEVTSIAEMGERFETPKNLRLAWKISRLNSWLNNVHDHEDIDSLQEKLERLNKKEFEKNSELVTIMAWQRQIDRVTPEQRAALQAWAHEMKQYGKGTGKYAVQHMRAAQEALKEAKDAVPVWIMPLNRVAQMFSEPKSGMFDVVIFDEASQCDIKAVNIGYLGKKLLVVGDPEQISPAGGFQDQEKIFELISRFLSDVPFKESFSITSSLFDLAKIRLSNIVQLNEHFRCVPEIISFSNHHIYEGKLQPLRYPQPKGQLKPALVPVFVSDGYQNKNNKANEPEARAIVDKLVECLRDPQYQVRPNGKVFTFGIISLLAEDQVKFIKNLLINHPEIGERVIEERDIVVGDSYEFQGDERDVIFLSMVGAVDPSKAGETVSASGYTDEKAKQRFNVAASRARDQVFLFHSIPKESFGNPNDWRYKLLNWYYDPKKEELNAGREALKKEFDSGRASQFSLEVGNLLIDKGYQVIPEYPVIGYRIDLVIQGEESRLAIECDGDQYHTLENWDNDQIREGQLRRAGWQFWRVTGSAFYKNKDKAMDTLWKKLSELKIKPLF